MTSGVDKAILCSYNRMEVDMFEGLCSEAIDLGASIYYPRLKETRVFGFPDGDYPAVCNVDVALLNRLASEDVLLLSLKYPGADILELLCKTDKHLTYNLLGCKNYVSPEIAVATIREGARNTPFFASNKSISLRDHAAQLVRATDYVFQTPK